MRGIPPSVAEPQDIVQDAAVSMIAGEKSVENPEGYLYTASRHRIIDISKHESVLERRAGHRVPLESAVAVAAQTSVEDQVQATLQRTAVIAALRQLPERQRQVLTLRYYGGYSETQIAKRLGISRGTVKSSAFLGKATLRKIMGTNPNSDE
jgi:RNA polymerase sigma factor (sigma-70 family)